MSYFGTGSPEEDILDNCKSIQEETGVSNNQIILALAKVMAEQWGGNANGE